MLDPIITAGIWAVIQLISAGIWLYITYYLPSLSKQAGFGIIFHVIALLLYTFKFPEMGIFVGILTLIIYGYPVITLKKNDMRSKMKDPWGMYNMMNIVFDSIPVPMFIKDADFKVIMVNKAFTDAFGLDIEDFEKMTVVDQGLIWGYDESREFKKSDLAAIESDDTVIRKATLFAPKPELSILENPERPHDYIVVKRAYRLSHYGDAKGIIGMAINSELIEAKLAEIEHLAEHVSDGKNAPGEIRLVIDMLHQMDKKMDGVIVRVGFLEQRNEAHHHHIRKNNEILEKLLRIKKELRETIDDTDETWEMEIDPNKEKGNDSIGGVM